MFETKEAISRNINDSFFELNTFSNSIFITVYPPIDNGNKVTIKEVIDKLLRNNIKQFNRNVIELAISKQDKIPVKIADQQEQIEIKAKAEITVSSDKMKAFATITVSEEGKVLCVEDYLLLLKVSNVIYGINMELLESLSKHPVYNEPICIAEGTLPKSGKKGKIELHFDIKRKHSPKILEDGTVDYRRLDLIEAVTKGQVLCTLVPPSPGISGMNIYGINIPAPEGKPVNLPRGKNVEVTNDGLSLVSSIDGRISYIDGKVNVFNTYQVHGDVDNSTGNISFVGNVTITGNVLSGFVVDAGGDVEVGGVVEGAFIKAGGDIILKRGMQGLGKGTLVSGGEIVARYIENSKIEAKNNIKADTIMHSNIKCGNTLELSGRKGLLVGGTCRTGKEVSAKVIGSNFATATSIEVGIDPELKTRHTTLKTELSSIEIDLQKSEQVIKLLSKLAATNSLPQNKLDMLERSLRTKKYLGVKLKDIKEELVRIEAEFENDSRGKVRALNCIFSGTKITIGSIMMIVKENLQYCTVYRDGADLKVGPIDM